MPSSSTHNAAVVSTVRLLVGTALVEQDGLAGARPAVPSKDWAA
jgi:hypothetical protein